MIYSPAGIHVEISVLCVQRVSFHNSNSSGEHLYGIGLVCPNMCAVRTAKAKAAVKAKAPVPLVAKGPG